MISSEHTAKIYLGTWPTIPYSGNLLREEIFTNLAILLSEEIFTIFDFTN